MITAEVEAAGIGLTWTVSASMVAS